ncbi:MAG: LuxR C-terminal-related transcriptional regulator [Herbinix sp.]|nr:LuxR C-terminal-related transcriptional regulator [Herbinix sp.]
MNNIIITEKNITISKELHKKWKKLLNQYGRLYLYAMSGFGKSENALIFAELQFSEWKCFSAGEKCFLEMVGEYIEKNQNTRVRTLLILDDLQWVLKEDVQMKLVQLLANINPRESKLQSMLISRAPLPAYLTPFYLTRQLIVENKDSLWLKEEHIRELLRKENFSDCLDEDVMSEMVKKCINITKGYPIGICSFIRQIKEGYRDYAVIYQLAREDIYQYFDRTLFVKWENKQKETILKLAVYPKFNIAMAEYILGPEAKAMIDGIMLISSFFHFIPPDQYEIHPFFLQYLISRLRTMSIEKRSILYYNAGQCYEKMREMNHALRCYKEAKQYEKIAELIIYLSENIDGNFAKTSQSYFSYLPEEVVDRYPKLLGAKTLLYSYQMKLEESNQCLDQLKDKAMKEKRGGAKGEAMETYVRTLIALPHGTAEQVRKKLSFFSSYIIKYGIYIINIIPTGNMPSVINGGLDFLSWTKNDKLIYPIMKKAVEIVIGKEAIGIADVCMGENLYEKNKRTESTGYLTKGLSDSNYKGSIRVQYAAVGVMARLFQCEGQADTAESTLATIRDKAKENNFLELLPNIEASLVYCALLKGDIKRITEWLQQDVPDEHGAFYITDRFCLFTKARVYVALGRDIEALFILHILEKYAQLYNRSYLQMEIDLLKSILLYRREEDWQALFFNTVKMAASYNFVHIISDQGVALQPLWKKIDWSLTDIKAAYINTVTKEIKKMTALYPNYLKEKHKIDALSKKELEVIQLMAEGYTNGQIANMLDVSTATVKFHIANLLKKLDADNRIMAVKNAKSLNIL